MPYWIRVAGTGALVCSIRPNIRQTKSPYIRPKAVTRRLDLQHQAESKAVKDSFYSMLGSHKPATVQARATNRR